LSRRALVVLFLLSLPLVTPHIRGADEIEYFSYLRSAVFDRDLEFGNEYQWFYDHDPRGLDGFKKTFLDRREPRTGRHINFGPLGSALLWSPFYLVAHAGVLVAHALGSGVAADGFSAPYQAAVCYASALYGLLGMLLIQDMLVRFGSFSEAVATWTSAALWLATPVFYYMTLAPAFSHACSLFAVSLLLWLWLRARERDRLLDWLAVGAMGGLAALVREQDLLFLALPGFELLWRALRDAAWRSAIERGAAMSACAALGFLPQLFAYHAINGSLGPSKMVARKMSYTSPHLLGVLFDPAHGLFFWTPLLVLATLGLALLVRRREAQWVLLAIGLLLQVWINGSVESWTQAGAFGSRRFVSATPVFAFGLAALVAAVLPRLGRTVTVAGLSLFVWWNVSLVVQFGLRLMDRQALEWPRVATNQVLEVPPRLVRTAVLFLTDREQLVRETR
jgi:hypothetical protein